MDTAVVVAIIGAVALLGQSVIIRWGTTKARRALTEKVNIVANDARESNQAVNHAELGMPTLVQRVTDQDVQSQRLARELAITREWQQQAFQLVAQQLGVALPAPPAPMTTPPLQTPHLPTGTS